MRMAHTRTLAVKTRPELVDFVAALGREASRLVKPVQVAGAVSLCAALAAWYLLFYSYAFDSLRSLGLCLAFFAFVLTPGFVFLWLGSSLRKLALLPRRLPGSKTAHRTVSSMSPASDDEDGENPGIPSRMGWFRKAKARVDTILILWEHLCFSREEIQQLAGPSRAMSFLSHPASAFVVGGACVIALFVALGSVLTAIASLVSRII